MFKKYILLTFYFTLVIIQAQELQKSAIKANGQLVYAQKQKQVEDFSSLFTEGNLYGRLRNNSFYFAYNSPDNGHETHLVSGVGASIVYKSASLSGFSFHTGLYVSHTFFDEEKLDAISHLKPAKDTLSRYKFVNGGSRSLYVIGQANLNYQYSTTNFTLGRQFVETFYTKSNDTKMVPNTFDGLVVSSKEIKDSKLTLAYLAKQKLRDHENSHSVLMYGDASSAVGVNRPEWTQNDDSTMHKGLTYTALKAAGKSTDAPLIILEAQNKSIKNLKINFSSYMVPELLAQTMGELNYKINFDGFSVIPAFRYIQQFDNGAGAVGGASITTNTTGYKSLNSLDARMIAARVVTKISDYKINLGYTNILDEADLVTPWRGFPTAGYTRSMGMYNWRANTKSYRLELVKGANKSGVYKTPFIQTSVLYIDEDENKNNTDSMFYYVGLIQNIPAMAELQYKVRFGYRDFIHDSANISSYIDSRLELNYLF